MTRAGELSGKCRSTWRTLVLWATMKTLSFDKDWDYVPDYPDGFFSPSRRALHYVGVHIFSKMAHSCRLNQQFPCKMRGMLRFITHCISVNSNVNVSFIQQQPMGNQNALWQTSQRVGPAQGPRPVGPDPSHDGLASGFCFSPPITDSCLHAYSHVHGSAWHGSALFCQTFNTGVLGSVGCRLSLKTCRPGRVILFRPFE